MEGMGRGELTASEVRSPIIVIEAGIKAMEVFAVQERAKKP